MKEVVAYVVQSHGYSQRRAFSLASQHRSTRRKPSRRDPRLDVRQRMREIAATRVRYGYRRIHVLLRREGWTLGRDVVWRLYWEKGLALRSKRPRRRKMVVQRERGACRHARTRPGAWTSSMTSSAMAPSSGR